MGRVYKRPDRPGKYYIEWRDHRGKVCRRAASSDKSVATRMLADCERQAERVRLGYSDRFEQSINDPLANHLKDYRTSLESNRKSPQYIRKTVNRITLIMQRCRFSRWTDVTGSAVEAIIGSLEHASPSTRNAYLKSIKSFLNWMVVDRRAPESPLAYLRAQRTDVDIRRVRRALTIDELSRLLTAAESGPCHSNMDGMARSLCYQLALSTGLRANEIRTLRVGSFDFDRAEVVVEAAYSKRRRRDVQPIPSSLVGRLREHFAFRLPMDQAFALCTQPARMIRRDLKAAGIAYRDESGRCADFHALRHTYITNLHRAGVDPKIAQVLARHSSINLTMDCYTHVRSTDVNSAVEKLPNIVASSELRETGTADSGARHGALSNAHKRQSHAQFVETDERDSSTLGDRKSIQRSGLEPNPGKPKVQDRVNSSTLSVNDHNSVSNTRTKGNESEAGDGARHGARFEGSPLAPGALGGERAAFERKMRDLEAGDGAA